MEDTTMTEEQRQEELEDEDLKNEFESENSQTDDSSDTGDSTVPIEDYKNLQGAFTHARQEVTELKERLSQLEQSRSETDSKAESDALSFLDSDEVKDEIDADPSCITGILKQAVTKATSQLESEMVATLSDRDKYYHGKFLSQDPTYQEYKDEIERMREEEPAFKSLSDEQMMAVVKRTKTDGGKGKFRGNAGGGRSPGSKSSGKSKDIKNSNLYKKIYGGE